MESTFVYPNQLFDPHPAISRNRKIYLIEDPLFFGDIKYPFSFNKKKILLHYLSMSYFSKGLKSKGYQLEIINHKDLLHDDYTSTIIKKNNITIVHLSAIVDFELEKRINHALKVTGAKVVWHDNPNFLLNNTDIENDFRGKKFHFMAHFYKKQRKRFNVLVSKEGKPIGERWSFDDQNRKKLPKKITLPDEGKFSYDNHLFAESVQKVESNFSNNLGSVEGFNFPTSHNMAMESFQNFLENKLELFGPYEDAIPKTNSKIFHSVLTPYLNIGLISPKQVVDLTLEKSMQSSIPINSLEGFIRQIIGWREFIRGIYQECGARQRTNNFWGFTKKLPDSFYHGGTGLDPVDFVIKKSCDEAYAHHIERLMIMGNIFCLLRINPDDVYKWFMEYYIDAYDWVMVPNVYGMSQFADGGLMSTKPYISGSNYILKMSDYQKGNWTEIWDALYWDFIRKERDFFLKNPRMAMMVRIYDKKSDQTKNEYKSLVSQLEL